MPSYEILTPQSLTNSSRIAAIFLADEPDGEVDSSMLDLLQATTDVWRTYPGLPTYQGGKTSRNDGAFAGINDIQGIDMYVAACAPHIQEVGYGNATFFLSM
jgi:hypothetical protein